jgi:hypothetical protein
MYSLDEVTYLDALLLMCLHLQSLDRYDPEYRDALRCIKDCERRQMELQHNG